MQYNPREQRSCSCHVLSCLGERHLFFVEGSYHITHKLNFLDERLESFRVKKRDGGVDIPIPHFIIVVFVFVVVVLCIDL